MLSIAFEKNLRLSKYPLGRAFCKPPFLCVFARSLNCFTKTEVLICVYVQKRSSVNGELVSLVTLVSQNAVSLLITIRELLTII